MLKCLRFFFLVVSRDGEKEHEQVTHVHAPVPCSSRRYLGVGLDQAGAASWEPRLLTGVTGTQPFEPYPVASQGLHWLVAVTRIQLLDISVGVVGILTSISTARADVLRTLV